VRVRGESLNQPEPRGAANEQTARPDDESRQIDSGRPSRPHFRVLLAVGIPLIATAIAIAAFVSLNQATMLADEWVAHTFQVRADLQYALVLLVDAETGVRGYVMSSQPDYLQPYQMAQQDLTPALNQLLADVQDNPSQTDRVRQIEPLAAEEMQRFATLVSQSGARPDLSLLAQSKAGMDDLRQQFSAMDAEEVSLLNERLAAAVRLRTTMAWAILGSIGLGLFGAVLSWRLIRQLLMEEDSARVRAEDAVHQRDEFIAIASHELKNPLTVLRGTVQSELRRIERPSGADQERTNAALANIERQSTRLATLAGQLLDVSRLRTGRLMIEPSETDVAALVESVAEAARQRLTHAIIVDSPRRLNAVIDPIRIEQVLTNLVDNAMKFSPAGTPVEVTLSQPRPSEIRIAVTDHGVGIPPDRRAGLFEPYYQAHAESRQRGLGLGLYVSRRIVELHGGRIVAEFPEEGSTRFVVELPIRPPTSS
jgi:signal transduction histidine kinase